MEYTASSDFTGTDLGELVVEPDFLDDYERLPASAPADHAHIIDTESYESVLEMGIFMVKFRIWDAIATTLLNISPRRR